MVSQILSEICHLKQVSGLNTCLTLSRTTNFKLFQTKTEFADDNFKFQENGRKFSDREENTVGKGEIARY